MIFANLNYSENYKDLHDDVESFLSGNFECVKSGLQLDSWFWIVDGNSKVKVDTFSSMKHQVKCAISCTLVQQVIAALQQSYEVRVYPEPLAEDHERAESEANDRTSGPAVD